MGNYITQTDLEERITLEKLIALTDDAKPPSGAVDAANMNRCINDAEAEANVYIAMRHSVPMSPVPAIVKAMTLDIVVYKLHARRKGASEDVTKRYENAVRFFDKIAAGKISLGVDILPTESPNEGGPRGSKGAADRVFTETTLKNF